MQKLIALIIFVQFSCLSTAIAQRGSVKASDACPGSNKNTRTSKEYASLSTRSAADNTSDFSKPRYQSIYSKKTVANTEMRRGKAVVAEAKTVSAKKAKKADPLIEKRVAENKEEKATPIVEEEEEPVIEKSEPSKPMDVIQTDKPLTAPKENNERPEGTTASSKKSSESSTKPKSKSASAKAAAADKKSAEKSKTNAEKEKQYKKACVKKTRFGKKSPTDCPEF